MASIAANPTTPSGAGARGLNGKSHAVHGDDAAEAGRRMSAAAPSSRPPFARLLRDWRTARKLSQLSLAVNSNISQRHLSFLESGRAMPSRDMVLHLSESLDVPLRERNAMLTAAGYAPLFRTRTLQDPEMKPVAQALSLMLRHHEPNPALVVDRDWNIVMSNNAMLRLMGLMGDADALWQRVCGDGPRNIMRLTFHPEGMRPYIANWSQLAPLMIGQLRREAAASGSELLRDLLAEALKHPDLPASVQRSEPPAAPQPVIPLELSYNGASVKLFSVISTFGTAQDVTTDEMRIESFFPADDGTAQLLQMLAAAAPKPN